MTSLAGIDDPLSASRGFRQIEIDAMPLTPEERRNERLKLAANWVNTLATAIVTAGTFVPLAQFVYGVLPPNTPAGLIYGSGVVCIVTGVLIHLLGQWILGGLR